MSSQQDFEALAKLRSDVAADIEMRRYQLEGIDLSIECLRATAKPLVGAAAAAVAGKNNSPKEDRKSDDRKPAGTAKPAAEPLPAGEPAPAGEPVPQPSSRARLTDVSATT